MSIDGTFSLHSAFDRFIARCPELQSIPRLKSLSQKGDKLTEEELVSSVAELVINSKYTIPLIGCFRPIATSIVDKAVDLLRLVPNLTSVSDESSMEIDSSGSENEAYIVDSYVRSGRGLRLHELACLALCRALDLLPFLLQSVLSYFKFAPTPFQRLLEVPTPRLVEKDGSHLLDAVRASFRFLVIESQVFSALWDWSFFCKLVKLPAIGISGNVPEVWKDIRWCAVQIIFITLEMSDRAIGNLGFDADTSLSCLFRWEEFCQDISLEKAGWYLEKAHMEKGGSVDGNIDFNQEYCLQSFGLRPLSVSLWHSNEVESLRRNKKLIAGNENPVDDHFVLTSAVKKSFEMVLLAVSQKWPVLLYGPTGAGKTALINKLAQVSGSRVLAIHMDEQMDGKTLIGSYICSDQPGEFRWQPGFLTQAVLNGFWVVFEDIDKAPSDVQTILLPLLECASSFTTGRGEAISVAESFRLFATVSSSRNNISHNSEGGISLGALWRRVMVIPSSEIDLLDILNAWYPSLEVIAQKLIETFVKVNSSLSHPHEGLQSFGRFSTRDLLKWCKRIAKLELSSVGLSLSAYERRVIYQEAVDIFAASYASCETRLLMMKEIAKIWEVPAAEAETLFPSQKPTVQEFKSDLRVGRVTLKRTEATLQRQTRSFVDIRSSLHVLERIACSIKYNEPVLLVGETGTGKTTLVQNLAVRLSQPLIVLNLSQQSDVADLLGGFKPTDPLFICVPLYNEFLELFSRTFSTKDNIRFLSYLRNLRTSKNWIEILKIFQKGFQKALDYYQHEAATTESSTKRKRPLDEEILKAWRHFSVKLDAARRQIDASSSMAFSFVEGAFITALRNGHWILLDEVNLAPPETLQRIMGVLEGESGSLCLAERGDAEYIARHPDFRLFACMNPATDAGKRDLPYSVRSRFTEYFVDEVLDDEDLTMFVNQFMDDSRHKRGLVSNIVRFYKEAKRESEERLQDGANQKPQFSLRSLYRALEYVKKAERKFGFQKALYDGFCMFFLTLLDGPSAKLMNDMISSFLLGGNIPRNVPFNDYLMVADNSKFDASVNNYILTNTVTEHLRNLSRSILIKKYPVLLQGPTSSGKTSLVQYLASVTGHEFVRINNHEHTDLQEYLGSYITNANGQLVFQEGVLVKAVRTGSWIVLDELNLAPSDVLEALNRLLDDNRELFVPELQETIKAHPHFMLFATQNPPTFYGGRKLLSRAFRNRFVEIHVEEIPESELSIILEKRCLIPGSYAKRMVEVMKDLQLHRQSSKAFAGKHGFITPRDLFRWAERFRIFGRSYEDLAKDGYFLLAERLREEDEKKIVQEILEKRLRVKLVLDDLYKQEQAQDPTISNTCKDSGEVGHLRKIIWTKSMQRLYFLVERCYKLREPVLLVGETAGGKTTVCQLLSAYLGSKLHILNCHQYTETSDFIGGFYPLRDRSKLTMEFKSLVEKLMLSNVFLQFPGSITLSSDIGEASSTINQLKTILSSYEQGQFSCPNVTKGDFEAFETMKMDLVLLHQKWQTIFTWQDGPLVQAMKNDDVFLVDEISLADDSVLERLNSVLEPERRLSLAEKGGAILENVTANPNFFLLATMNPGGDYGKKELSPALRNRFTEIWVPAVGDSNELRSIAQRYVGKTLSYAVDPMINFWEWFNDLRTGRFLTVRDLLSWVDFMNATERSFQSSEYAFLHGAFLVLLDGLSLGTGISKHDAEHLRKHCLSFLLEYLKRSNPSLEDAQLANLENYGWGVVGSTPNVIRMQSDHHFGIDSFYINKGSEDCKREGFEFSAPTTCRNAMRILRAMQLSKPVLLEGSPGVGKTSLIVALGKYSGHRVVRINLSEQTDIMDLLGSDLPVEDSEGMKFAWSDGILLQAIKNGDWVLLDELNLAPQSVLEGLNAILDHRAEVFIPELGLTIKCDKSFRVFASQNPSYQGGGRKGLPKSFLNRFTKVYIDELLVDDYLSICSSLHPSIPKPLLSKLIAFNKRMYEDTMISRKYGQDGSPWEFNLRDIIRSCEIIEGAPEESKEDCFLHVIYIARMRATVDREQVIKLYEEIFGKKPFVNPYPRVQINPRYLIVGNTFIERNHFQPSKILKSQLNILPGIYHSLEAVVHCVRHQWLCILVGPSSSGKTSLVRLLAHVTGNVLNELNLSHASDISELLGCFEQYNAFRNFHCALSQVKRFINEYCSLCLESSLEEFIIECEGLVSNWFTFVSSINCNPNPSSAYAGSASADTLKSGFFDSLVLLMQIVEQIKLGMQRNQLSLSWSFKDLDRILKTITDLQENYRKRAFPVKFEWVTGLLVKAIEHGEWIILENANLCNPTVLDRLNSLVEPTGSITINEGGHVDGKPMVIHPHSRFRLFLSVNPKYGEVSRAMRNRGVEIFMMEPNWPLDVEHVYNWKEVEERDVKRFLVLNGIPTGELVDRMAKAHMFARDTGLSLGVRITLLELTRWVQLFQQLLMNGNKPIWSLQLSWEHSYLSSLGEGEGKYAVEHAKTSLLSVSEFSKSVASHGHSLFLPGGWPTPFRLRNLVWHFKEACVRQNCQYLEFLGAQYTSYQLSAVHHRTLMEHNSSLRTDRHTDTSVFFAKTKLHPSIIPLKMLVQILFPKTSYQLNLGCDLSEFDMELANKMLLFAADWTIDQASEDDLELYFEWFSWYSSRFQPYCCFFEFYLTILKQVQEHPIWKCVLDCRRELISRSQINVDMASLPLLSLKLMEYIVPNMNFEMFITRLGNAIQCVGLLRSSFQQWKEEDDFKSCKADHPNEVTCFYPLLDSLKELEKVVLDNLIDFSDFDQLFDLYKRVIEYHKLLWNGIITMKYECLRISWRFLHKDAVKLQNFFPEQVKKFQVQSCALANRSRWSFHSLKSMLWVNGGHPILPFSSEIYSKLQQLLELCELIWPKQTISSKLADINGNDCLVKYVTSANTELRSLAMQGVCMSSYITRIDDQDDSSIVQQLEEMHLMLLERFEHEEQKLKAVKLSKDDTHSEEKLASCCSYSTELLCSEPYFNSWREILPLFESTSFFLDMKLLRELSCAILVDAKELFPVLSCNYELMEFSLNFSLAFSSRPPTDFIPHQRILWALDSWESVDSVNTTIASSILEMWFRWHSCLWTSNPDNLKMHGFGSPLLHFLFQPTKTATLDRMLHGAFPIKDFAVHSLKLRVASMNVWNDSPEKDLPEILFSAVRSLFQQIIYAHKKSFDEDKYSEIKSRLSSDQAFRIKEENIQALSLLIASSSHSRLTSLMDLFVVPLLKELHLQHPSHDFLNNIGRAWFLNGALRFHLLLTPDDLDPAIKYSFKHSQLVEKIYLLELESKVRQECENLVGRISTKDVLKQRVHSLEKLKVEQRRVQRKVVYRHDTAKFKRLNSECGDFVRLVTSSVELIKNLEATNITAVIDEALNWQEIAASFINRLSDEYTAYVDIVQPIQVAVYEMKLGFSLVVASALQKTFLDRTEGQTTDQILEAIYSFMHFPRSCTVIPLPSEFGKCLPDYLSPDPVASTNICDMDLKLLDQLCLASSGTSSDNMVLQLQASFYHNIFVRVIQHIADSLLIEYTSFKFLNEIFEQFVDFWMSMKVHTKEKEDVEARNYTFKPRAFNLDDILEVDISNLRNSLSDESLCLEWQHMMAEDECAAGAPIKESGNPEEEWNLIPESTLKSIVDIHNQLFGSTNLVDHLGFLQISDMDKLVSFIESYKLGTTMVKGLPALLSSSLDAKLAPEHILYLCLKYEENFGVSHGPPQIYNFYKDPNASVIAKMVKPLTSLQQRLLSLLNKWLDHPGLNKILEVTEMMLAIPLTTPLAKALSGLQFLLSRAQILEETDPKIYLSDQLQPIVMMLSSWQKIELDSWPDLLDGVQVQHEVNAGKLWFPLYSVLHRGKTANVTIDNQTTIRSLEEFIETSSVGEFKKRLQLLLAFHGQFSSGIHLKFYASPNMLENQKILYNVFGYYVQFLPIVLEHIEVHKRNVAEELKKVLKLYRWDRHDNYLSIETSRRNRQKLRKIIQKLNDTLQQPVMTIINQDAVKRGIKLPSMLGLKVANGVSQTENVLPHVSTDFTVFNDTESCRTVCSKDWAKGVSDAMQNMCPRAASGFDLKDVEEIEGLITQAATSQYGCLTYPEEWKTIWLALEKICRTIAECYDLWKEEKRSLGKRRALSDFIKLLESCGLSRHKYVLFEDAVGSNQMDSWFLQPSYNVHHLLLPASGKPGIDVDKGSSDSNWPTANQYYYKSMAQVQLLRQICSSFHKDFTVDQVTRSVSFLEHLVVIQQEQRSVAYHFSEDLKRLKKCSTYLVGLDTNPVIAAREIDSEASVSSNQSAIHKCMWQQKQLFDTLYAISRETALLLRKVENTHLNECQSVKVAANSFLVIIEKYIPIFQKSKESLDYYLLNGSRSVTTPAKCLAPFLVSKKMEKLVMQNFQQIIDFDGHLHDFSKQGDGRRSVKEPLIGQLRDILTKGKLLMEEFYSVMEPRNEPSSASIEDGYSDTLLSLEAAFAESFKSTLKQIKEAFQKVASPMSGLPRSEESSSGNITQWKVVMESYLANLRLDVICRELDETIKSAVRLIDNTGHTIPGYCSQIQIQLNLIHVLVEPLVTLGGSLLLEFLAMHKTVAEMTHMLAYAFASLYYNGFSGEESTVESNGDFTQDASGTGMGEGAGVNDVSDQITDEDQLLGTSEKPNEGLDSNEVPSKEDKGIEMDEDFNADTFSVSEDSGDDNSEDGEEEKLESAMGDTGTEKEVVDEKLWDKDEDGDLDSKNEKYESGPSVQDKNSNQRELRAKEDDLSNLDESGEIKDDDETNEDNSKFDEQNASDHDENMDDLKMDKEAAYADPTGIEIDEKSQDLEGETENGEPEVPDDLEETEGLDTMEEDGPDAMEEADQVDNDEIIENGDDKDITDSQVDEGTKENGFEEVGGDVENDDASDDRNDKGMELSRPPNNAFELGPSDFAGCSMPTATQLNDGTETSKPNATAQAPFSNSSNVQNGRAPSKGTPSNDVCETELVMPDSVMDGNLSANKPKAQTPEHDNSSAPRTYPNPYRSVGDALEKWKERIKVSTDLQEHKAEGSDDMENENADEYGFVSEFEKGTSQALGPATSEQIDRSIKGSNPNDDGVTQEKESIPEMEVQKQDPETLPFKSYSAPRQVNDKKVQNLGVNGEAPEDKLKEDNDDCGSSDGNTKGMSGDLVSFKKSYMNEEIMRLSNLTVNEEEVGKGKNHEEMAKDGIVDVSATMRWNELMRTSTKLSQELAEQLRLIMEPTLASKLQGDYKTGKRINMKKVIPYIASHYRKDKIWMRRTRPNKRDYQVIVAVDDSRSMSESHCVDVAVEALVTVCRAMSQLEVGQLAVASFGKKGNIRLLHDFDRPFTGEAGMNMISSLTFKQENTIADEPVFDLLKNLDNMLDAAVAKSRLPSGQNPLQQLILIIADGRFHEKEKLKRCVRDVLNKKRMVAFLLVDSPQESIMEFMEASFEDNKVTLSKYLDSFPFPYYIILKNIEALPGTLANLLRQWFELMQNARD